MDLEKKVAIVSGGSNGIGKEIARQLIELGSKVYLTGRNRERLERSAVEIAAIPVLADASNQDEIDALFKRVMQENDKLDILINNAGFGAGWAELGEISMDDMLRVYQTNVLIHPSVLNFVRISVTILLFF